MRNSTRSGWLRLSAVLALVVLMSSALPLSLIAQVRRPDPVPAGRRAAASVPKRRSELLFGLGNVNLEQANGTGGSVPLVSLGYRRQFRPEWLLLGGIVEVGRTAIDGEFFPYERRSLGDSSQFVSVDGSATLGMARLTADVLLPIGEDERYHAGAGVHVGMYGAFPSPAGGAGAGAFVAPTYGATFVGRADITRRLGAMGSIGFVQFTGFDRDRLRPSDPALEEKVFTTPFTPPPAGVKSFGSARFVVGVTYRLGVKPAARSTR